ncbi:hypothetical protein [Flexithrix dorotheae]|nr:hypothetical protein [Flexithrix dorotheae]
MKRTITHSSTRTIEGKVTQEIRDKENKTIFKVTFTRKSRR